MSTRIEQGREEAAIIEALIPRAIERLNHPPSSQTIITPIEGIPGVTHFITGIHDTTLGENNPNGATLGGTRVIDAREYGNTPEEQLRNASKLPEELARDMTFKWLALIMTSKRLDLSEDIIKLLSTGGGKTAILAESIDAFKNLTPEQRKDLFVQFGHHILSMNGLHTTGVDMHTTMDDMAVVHEVTGGKYVTCKAESIGGTGNPSPVTAEGVWSATKAIGSELGINPDIATYTVQGVGSVGSGVVERIFRDHPNARVIITDIDTDKVNQLLLAYADFNINAVEPEEIYSQPADVFIPCSIPNIVSQENLSSFVEAGVKAICPAANDIYPVTDGSPDPDTVSAYHQSGITVVSAPLANLGGILDVASQFYPEGPDKQRSYDHVSRGLDILVREIFQKSQDQGVPFEDVFSYEIAKTYAEHCVENGIQL